MIPNPEDVTRILEEAAEAEIMPRFQSLSEEDIHRKASGELVTVADEAAERLIARRLAELLPGSVMVGEEAVAADASLLRALENDKPVWTIDPIDGTGNFTAGRPQFAVMVALVLAREILAGWILDPINGETAVAVKGEGAYCAGQRISVSSIGDPGAMSGTLHAGEFATPEMKRHIDARRQKLDTQRTLRSAGKEYLRLAKGESDYTLFTKLMPWDHAPGYVIHSEAGGAGYTLDHEIYRPVMQKAPALLLAPNEESWHWLNETLFDGADPKELTGWYGNFAVWG